MKKMTGGAGLSARERERERAGEERARRPAGPFGWRAARGALGRCGSEGEGGGAGPTGLGRGVKKRKGERELGRPGHWADSGQKGEGEGKVEKETFLGSGQGGGSPPAPSGLQAQGFGGGAHDFGADLRLMRDSKDKPSVVAVGGSVTSGVSERSGDCGGGVDIDDSYKAEQLANDIFATVDLLLTGSLYTPQCDKSLQPVIGMTFDDIESAKQFYTAYAAHAGFLVRMGQHQTKNGLVMNKRFYCSREGFRKAQDETQSEPECSGKRKYERKITRCGCLAMIAIKRTKENAYCFLRVGLGGFENVGCTLRDLQNYHGKLSTNEYNIIFTPFTGLNHQKANVLFGAALLSDEKIESYTWLFKTFLNAMGGVEPALIIIDEDGSMKAAIQNVFVTAIHRLCMWHILRKVCDKVGPELKEDDEFHSSLSLCIWSSETPEEFEERWARIMIQLDLEHHEWFAGTGRFDIRSSWVPAYFRDIPLSGLLRTTSRSESANSYFSRFIGFKHALVEFWLRFGTALEDQQHKELEADNVTLHTTPILKTSWGMEKHGSEVFTHEVFAEFQQELLAAREYCIFESMQQDEELKTMRVANNSKKVRVVQLNTSTMFASCSCMLFETHGIPCRHVIHVLRSSKMDELPSTYILKRFRKDCKKEPIFCPNGMLLEERTNTPVNPVLQKLISDTSNKMESLLIQAKHSLDAMQILRDGVFAIGDKISDMVSAKELSTIEEFEEFLGCPIPVQVDIHPPNDIRSKGRIKRIKGHADKGQQKNKNE
ncbi:hypothetical protein U9M48_019495 [Paspalum notatum var. saurae]|uniref:SWIM-type domain-containing protein n=1 Tax=Paspalum notatum var. saurae TaxID=547442 RepID=A0AAQ3TDA4_PASNO